MGQAAEETLIWQLADRDVKMAEPLMFGSLEVREVLKMPIHFSPSRRRFLAATSAAAAYCVFAKPVASAEVDDDLVYVLNDTHIGEKHPHDSPVPTHLRQVVAELLALPRRPAAVIVNGDLALKDGQPGDYRHLAELLKPLREARFNLHLTLGNHDDRDVFYEVLRDEKTEVPAVASKHLAVVQTRSASFFLLDSLQKTMVTPGELGATQRKWLAAALDTHADRPAILVAHHNPRLGGDPLHFPGGLIDSQPLWDLIASRRHVKAYVHGHVHDRTYAEHQGIHIINTPATSYVADPTKSTTGWTVARFSKGGVELTTRTTDPEHAWNGERRELKWRT
ncbi:MAG: metallophosphoesterase [Planctomycetales bacterium]|nr:metallophosphoesterase [Planctomycetales bacterium]MCA9228552.1 metallophosphoesterase [Planctomycetales bacterium]